MAIVAKLKQSTATTLLLGPFLDDTDGKTAETALTLSQADVLLWKEGGTTLAQKTESTTCTHRSNGLYTCPVDTTDTNTLGVLTVSVAESGALPVRQDYLVITADEWNRQFLTTGPIGVLGIVDRGTTQSTGSTSTVIRSATDLAANDIANNCVLGVYYSGGWEYAVITDYVTSTDTVTHEAFPVTPTGTIPYVIIGGAAASTTNPVPANMTQILGTAVVTPATAGLLDVNVKQISTDATAADNLELAYDGTGYAGGTTLPNVNVEKINDTAVNGTGVGGDLWRGA
jgi:hypothetical protein